MTDVSEKALREQALRLAESFWRGMEPHPLKSPSQIAPICFSLLRDGLDPNTIVLALQRARAHTPSGVQVALAEVNAVARSRAYRPAPPAPNTKAHPAVVAESLRSAREALRPQKEME